MSIVKTITDDYYFWNWLKKSDSYSNNFSLEGAKALQEYYDNLGDEPIEFDPITWCCEFAEYESLKEACKQYDEKQYFGDGQSLDDYTTVITLDNGGVLVREF